jgi:hypothetical protein
MECNTTRLSNQLLDVTADGIVHPEPSGQGILVREGAYPPDNRTTVQPPGESLAPSEGSRLHAPLHPCPIVQPSALPQVQHAEPKSLEREAQRHKAWAQCQTLAQHPHILDCFAQALEQHGVVGEVPAVKLLYLVVTSRLLERPVSCVVKGPSSGGKSYLVQEVLRFFPAHAYYALSAMSERALAHSKEPLVHRVLVIYEAAGLRSDFTSYLLRSLLSEGRVRYEIVEKKQDGFQARLIEREGPTGLLVTTTAIGLHPENETRLLSLTVTDTPDQTRRVLHATASQYKGAESQQRASDLTPWHAFQAWLEAGDHRVSIPYADHLAVLIQPVATRLRRDFMAVLTLIRTHALLHQACRERDGQGSIVATLEDYAVVRDLVAPLVSEGVEATVSPTIRETVETVRHLVNDPWKPEVQIIDVANALHLDKSAASRRVKAALAKGYLVNQETRRRQPADLILGDPLPEDQEILPTVEALASRCTGASGCEEHSNTQPIEEQGLTSIGCTDAAVREGMDTPSPLRQPEVVAVE